MFLPAMTRFRPRWPTHLWVLAGLYLAASLAHFAHNAEFIALYPNMPAWLTRGQVYLVWLAITAIGALALACASVGWRRAGLALLGAWGAMGFDGLGHYTLALCTEHTLAMNLTIVCEVAAGAVLLGACAWQLLRRGERMAAAGAA